MRICPNRSLARGKPLHQQKRPLSAAVVGIPPNESNRLHITLPKYSINSFQPFIGVNCSLSAAAYHCMQMADHYSLRTKQQRRGKRQRRPLRIGEIIQKKEREKEKKNEIIQSLHCYHTTTFTGASNGEKEGCDRSHQNGQCQTIGRLPDRFQIHSAIDWNAMPRRAGTPFI